MKKSTTLDVFSPQGMLQIAEMLYNYIKSVNSTTLLIGQLFNLEQTNGSPLRLQGIKITRCLWSAWLAACSDRFWFPAENVRSFACFADCIFQRNKDFVMIQRTKTSVEVIWVYLLWYNVRKGLYRPEPQGSCNWYANLLLNVVIFLKIHNILQHYGHAVTSSSRKNKAML